MCGLLKRHSCNGQDLHLGPEPDPEFPPWASSTSLLGHDDEHDDGAGTELLESLSPPRLPTALEQVAAARSAMVGRADCRREVYRKNPMLSTARWPIRRLARTTAEHDAPAGSYRMHRHAIQPGRLAPVTGGVFWSWVCGMHFTRMLLLLLLLRGEEAC